jgi:hypothetical protein
MSRFGKHRAAPLACLSTAAAAGRFGEEYAPPQVGAWPEPRSVGPRERHQPHLSHRVEQSERNVSIDNIARIARGLKVKAWTLYDNVK